jgi:hypothetical protein
VVLFKINIWNRLEVTFSTAMPWLRKLVTGLSPLYVCMHVCMKLRFTPRSVHVRFVLDKVELRQAFLEVLWFSLSMSFHCGSPYSYIN